MTSRIFAAYGRASFMRSCARRILLAATISMALVIFCVLLTLAILLRISLVPGMDPLSVTARLRELFADLLQRRLVRLEFRLRVDCLEVGLAAAAREALERRLELDDLDARHLVHVAVVDGVDREGHLGHRHRGVLLLLHHFGDALAAHQDRRV